MEETPSTQAAEAEQPMTFEALGLSPTVLAAVRDLGYDEPTPVQAAAIPAVLAGRDLMAAAQTGTGKTAAFLLPTMDQLERGRHQGGPRLLVITPTRELAQQIDDVARAVARRTHHSTATVVGGVGYQPQVDALRHGTDVLVATPGRLIDLIEQGVAHLGDVEVLVLDEADRMLDMGFWPTVRRIVAETPESRQTLLLSATLDDSVLRTAGTLVHDPAKVEIARKGTVAETIDQFALPVSPEQKNALLAEVLASEGPHRVIVFTRTKHRADACCRRLRRAGIPCAPIHGNRSQNQREHALADFRADKIDVLVATDVLARGIDISDVRYVVNFDVPADPEDYIHRIGRTGRAGETGWALTFVTTDDVDDLFAIERLMGTVVPAFEPNRKLDLGEGLPVLDPNRTAGPAPRGGSGTAGAGEAGKAGRRSHKHGGRNKRPKGDGTATPAKPSGSHKDSDRSQKPKGDGGSRPARSKGDGGSHAPHSAHASQSAKSPHKVGRHPGDRGGAAARKVR